VSAPLLHQPARPYIWGPRARPVERTGAEKAMECLYRMHPYMLGVEARRRGRALKK